MLFTVNDSFNIKHSLGTGKPGSDEYILFETEKIKLPFYTDEDEKSKSK